MRNTEVAQFLSNIADMLEIKGESPFRVRAYRDAARQIESLAEDVEDIQEQGRLTQIPGVGESIATKISEYLETGRSEYYEQLKKEINPGIATLLEVPGVGPSKARLFYEKFGIDSIEKLEEAAREHKLSTVPTIGEKTEQAILRGIERLRGRSGRTPLGIALPTALGVLEKVRQFPGVVKADLAGSLRRMRDTIGDLDLLCASHNPAQVMERFVTLSMVREVLAKGTTKSSIVTHDGLQVDLRVVKPEEYGAALQYFTGSKEHNIHLRSIAESQGFKVNEYGIFRVSDNERVAGTTEESMYETLGLQWIPPELREDRGELEAARRKMLPDLIEESDLKGDLHIHTNWSDGYSSAEEVIEAARERGFEYIALADHSVSMAFVRGLTPERIREQRKLIDELNSKFRDIRVLQGIEVNIRSDGTLDYDDEVLAEFDIVTASIHTGMAQSPEKMTERILRAVRNPHVDIIGHPTGRIIGKRDPYEIDLEAILRAAAETGTAMEINSQPDRLDLRDTDVRMAKDMGVMLAINTDSHRADQFRLLNYGVATARRGWLEEKDVLNALSLDGLLRWLRK